MTRQRDPAEWFLTASQRGNPATSIDEPTEPEAWTCGNHVAPLIHGAAYFRRLVDRLGSLEAGDEVFIVDWRGDEDELMRCDGPRLGDLLSGLARAGVRVRGLLWRSHPQAFGFNQAEQGELARIVNDAGGEMFLDARIRRAGAHHQKLVALRHTARRSDDVAFVGRIDLCHGRRDDRRHLGDPQSQAMFRNHVLRIGQQA